MDDRKPKGLIIQMTHLELTEAYADLTRQLAERDKEIAELREGIKRLEWIDSADFGAERECPACWNFDDTDITRLNWDAIHIGHKPGCWLAKLIGEK